MGTCPSCGAAITPGATEPHECVPARLAEHQAKQALAELSNDAKVSALLNEWATDATKGLDEANQDARVTVTARRAFAEYLRQQEDEC